MRFNQALNERKGEKKREKTIKEKYGKKFVEKKKEIADAVKDNPEVDNPYAIAWAVTKKMKSKGKL